MLFTSLMEPELPKELKTDVNRLLDLKMNSPEVREIQRIDRINNYLDNEIIRIKKQVAEMQEETAAKWDVLNEMFLSEL